MKVFLLILLAIGFFGTMLDGFATDDKIRKVIAYTFAVAMILLAMYVGGIL